MVHWGMGGGEWVSECRGGKGGGGQRATSVLLKALYGESTHVLLPQGVHQLGQDLIGHHGLRQVIAVVGQTTQGQGGGLLDAGDLRGCRQGEVGVTKTEARMRALQRRWTCEWKQTRTHPAIPFPHRGFKGRQLTLV
jgi:hypothetical protein